MNSFIDLSKNYSFYSIPVATFLAFLPDVYGKLWLARNLLDPAYPRTFPEKVKNDEKLDKVIKNRVLRCQAASANGQETLPVFIGAVIASNVAGVPVRTINLLASSYLVSRLFFNIIYVRLQDNRKFAPARTLVWNLGVACWMTLLVKAANRMLEASS
ncbi:hypothetical protein F4779DRAFT_315314 [Xylariaceae sp. FL0662B]|nr:hypothetical protein F4779DRAFT_315314 [Xylariaceae sp. FL0662B]